MSQHLYQCHRIDITILVSVSQLSYRSHNFHILSYRCRNLSISQLSYRCSIFHKNIIIFLLLKCLLDSPQLYVFNLILSGNYSINRLLSISMSNLSRINIYVVRCDRRKRRLSISSIYPHLGTHLS